MRITYEQLLLTVKHYSQLRSLKLPIAKLLQLHSALRQIVEHLQTFESVKERVLETYNLSDDNERHKAEQELQEAIKEEVEIRDFSPIPIQLLGDQVFTLEFLQDTEWLWDWRWADVVK